MASTENDGSTGLCDGGQGGRGREVGKEEQKSNGGKEQGETEKTRTFVLGFMGSLGFGPFGFSGVFVGRSQGVCTLTQLQPLKMRMSIKSIFCNFRESLPSSRRRRRRLAHRADN